MSNSIKEIEEETIQRYSNRYKELGRDVKTLGWGSEQQQEYRFMQVLKNVDFNRKSVLDIGCGFGDFLGFLNKSQDLIEKYIGFDINEDLIKEAKKSHKDGQFFVGNVLEKDEKLADIGVMLGVLNFNFKEKKDNFTYTKEVVTKAFSLVNEELVVDFLSTKITEEYPKEDFVFYHDPAKVLEFAFSLTSKVKIVHNYKPIPQKEFLLILEH